ncbi:hypothetical protein [Halarcobacter bivalviorum]|uniref:Membrane protein n=1 Tax=Halarcobacter bivalviorum TaxID=663364 RepID=A0AAX2A5V0_9BACT|nr:hypothetical protein [Halarcobacter bivalviorum]AXH13057.1 putative membrane protein [Halarcobacter bivalviorum]RXK09140.1 hypothetical protein CRV05_11165 [Halarcobacter bivalviorum]
MEILRLIIAGAGGYLLASLVTVTLSLALPFSNKIEAISFSTMLSFLVWLSFILYSYSNIKLKSLLIQLSLLCANLYLINTCLIAIKA